MTVVIGRIGGRLRARSRAAAAGRSVPARRSPYQILIVLALLVAVVAAGVVILIRENQHLQAMEDARGPALNAARSHAEDLLSYDYRTIQDDVDRAADGATGSFRAEYVKTFKTVLFEQAKAQQTVVKAQVRSASVVDAQPDRVVVLLFVNQATTKKDAKDTKIDQPRVQMTLNKVDGKWLVSKVVSF